MGQLDAKAYGTGSSKEKELGWLQSLQGRGEIRAGPRGMRRIRKAETHTGQQGGSPELREHSVCI